MRGSECSPFATCSSGSQRYFLVGGIFLVLIPFAALAAYKVLVVDSAAKSQAKEKEQAEAADSNRRSVARPNEALAPFTDLNATRKALSKMTDKSGAPGVPGGVAVSVDGSNAPALAGLTPVAQPVSLGFDKLICTIEAEGKPKTIMQSVSGTFRAGRLSAVCIFFFLRRRSPLASPHYAFGVRLMHRCRCAVRPAPEKPLSSEFFWENCRSLPAWCTSMKKHRT